MIEIALRNTTLTHIVRCQELSRELVYEKRRVVHTNRKLEQCTSTCAELRESLALAQDTVSMLNGHRSHQRQTPDCALIKCGQQPLKKSAQWLWCTFNIAVTR